MKKRIYVASLLTIILTAAFFSPVLAKKQKKVVVEKFVVDISDEPFSCDQGFEGQLVSEANVTLLQWLDEDGNPTRHKATANITGEMIRLSDGRGVRDKATVIISGDGSFAPDDGTSEVRRGVFLNLKFPNKIHILVVGRFVLDENGEVTITQGKFPSEEENDVKACEGLASL